MDILSSVNTRRTPQSQRADSRQVKNAAGGYTFQAGDEVRLHRFLTLGTDGGMYYTSAADLTRDNAEVVFRAAASDPIELVQRIIDVSVIGRAPKQNPAIFALAIAASCDNVDGRRAALAALPRVCRTGTHLFLFAKYIEQFRGWGPTLRRAVGGWYSGRLSTDLVQEEAAYRHAQRVAYQVTKYRQREGWTHRDMLRVSHPMGISDHEHRVVVNWAVGKGLNDYPNRTVGAGASPLPRLEVVPDSLAIIADYEDAQSASEPRDWVKIIERGHGISWEMLPDLALTSNVVWGALLEQGIPQTALMRQLPRLTNLGLFKSGAVRNLVTKQLTDADLLKKARVHPVNVLVAQRTYTSGRSARGEGIWSPDSRISDALDAAFYLAYGAVEPANKRTLLALDVSGSMSSPVSGLPLSCREACAALAMVTAATEPDYRIVGFTSGGNSRVDWTNWRRNTALKELDISPRRRLDDICRYTSQIPFGGTDCALPMVWALKNRIEVDTFHIYTDNETWAGDIHPHQALREYRDKMGIDARLVVVAMTASGSSIADPNDPKQLDVSGFDSAVPNLLADFSRGDI